MNDDQLRARLRDADPAASLPPAEPDRVSHLLEDAMGHDTDTESRRTGTRGRSRLTWLVAAAAVVLIGVTMAYAALRGQDPEPVPTVEGEPTVVTLSLPDQAAAGRCMTPTPESLGRAEVAFDGEVADVTGSTVTLVPTRIYAGGPADNVRVAQASRSRQSLILGVRFEEGGRYLVAANSGEVMVCGFSGAYDRERADLYAEAFAG